jgi:hypothetical protein
MAVAAAAPVSADDERRERPDVDIDSLKASMRYYDGSWHVSVKYEVEVEDGVPSDLRLVLYFTDRGRTVLDPKGAPIEFIVPLDEPSEVDDDEIEFEETITLELPDRSFRNPRRLKVHAVAVYGPEGRSLDRKDRGVKLKTASRRYGRHRMSVRYRYSRR